MQASFLTSMTAAFRVAPTQRIRISALIARSWTARKLTNTYRMSSTHRVAISRPGYTLACPEDVEERRHHEEPNRLFQNPWPSFVDPGGIAVGLKILQRSLTGVARKPDVTPPTVNVVKPQFLPTRESNGSLRATWLGHASYLVEFPSGLRIVFDPVFEDRCSPVSFMGPKRFTEAPCKIEDIPIVDAVVISHNHYDHMSYPSLKKLAAKHPHVQFFVPLNVKKWFTTNGFSNITELDWWQTTQVTFTPPNEQQISASFSCLPAQHGSARTGWDHRHMLWAGWAVESGGKKLYFVGDSGYRTVPELPPSEDDYGEAHSHLPVCPAFKQIGELRGPFDLGLIPIGAYDPRFLFSSLHSNPYDSVNIFVDTKCKRALAMHWGAWVLTEEDVMEPAMKLKDALRRKGLPEEGLFDVCDIGESREF